MDPIVEIARRHGLIVIEDAAQAHGANTRAVASAASATWRCFSFYPGKNLGAYGEGGMVTTDNPDYAKRIRMLRDWGAEQKYHHVLKGYNFRLEGIQGAVLRVKLRHIESWTEARRGRGPLLRPGLCRQRHRNAPAASGMPPRLSCLRGAQPGTGRWQQELTARGRPDRHPLPDPGAPAAGLRGR